MLFFPTLLTLGRLLGLGTQLATLKHLRKNICSDQGMTCPRKTGHEIEHNEHRTLVQLSGKLNQTLKNELSQSLEALI